MTCLLWVLAGVVLALPVGVLLGYVFDRRVPFPPLAHPLPSDQEHL